MVYIVVSFRLFLLGKAPVDSTAEVKGTLSKDSASIYVH